MQHREVGNNSKSCIILDLQYNNNSNGTRMFNDSHMNFIIYNSDLESRTWGVEYVAEK